MSIPETIPWTSSYESSTTSQSTTLTSESTSSKHHHTTPTGGSTSCSDTITSGSPPPSSTSSTKHYHHSSTPKTSYTTSTIYSTISYTITSCPPTVISRPLWISNHGNNKCIHYYLPRHSDHACTTFRNNASSTSDCDDSNNSASSSAAASFGHEDVYQAPSFHEWEYTSSSISHSFGSTSYEFQHQRTTIASAVFNPSDISFSIASSVRSLPSVNSAPPVTNSSGSAKPKPSPSAVQVSIGSIMGFGVGDLLVAGLMSSVSMIW
ncbi:hypothetical protein BDZ45DRAFT_681390 [Acephala macrosclerotiorum]|nr:hypothetical protein BDZ45DRAFT_681390 [Acephala macrosclerotiorum]